jgi:hypothetical protein
MRNLFERSAKEQTVQEAEEEEPDNCQDPWLVLHIWNLDCDHCGSNDHDRGHCKSETNSERRIGGSVEVRAPVCVSHASEIGEYEHKGNCPDANCGSLVELSIKAETR